MGRLVAIKGIDRDLYKKIKAIASLEERTIGSIVNEALRLWLLLRSDRKYSRWLKIEEAYRENYRLLVKKYSELCERYKGKYLAICNAKFLGVFDSFEEAASSVHRNCSSHAFIIKIGEDIREREEIELGFPVEFI